MLKTSVQWKTSSQGAQVHMNCIENSGNVCITLSVPPVHQTAESKLCLQHHALCDKDRDQSISLSGSTRCQWVTSLILHRPYLKNSRITCEGQIYCLCCLVQVMMKWESRATVEGSRGKSSKERREKVQFSFLWFLGVVIFPTYRSVTDF